jgi:subfamily B ATP-binding cassette protein MsbA
VFERVSYVFDDADDATVRDVSLDIKKSEFVAIVGGSGAGKSTIIDLLCALRRPTEGSIRVDGIDLRDMDLMSWRRKLGYVTQEVAIFNDTIRNNLTIAVPDATDAEIADAISIAHLSQTIDQLPDGLDTVMGEGGVRLSGGQKQRLALARALVGNPSLLLLDEATSALDNESERLVQDAIDAIAHRFTIVVVAHRLSTVKKADRIHVMENGAIVETGTYDSLVAAEGRFATLHGLQFQ